MGGIEGVGGVGRNGILGEEERWRAGGERKGTLRMELLWEA